MSKYTSAGPRQLQAAQGSAEANGLGPDESPPAYSYIRFSHPDQAAGDSLRRQTEKAEAYCRRRGWALDRTLTLRDLGVSAYRGKNALVGNLRTFLEAIDRGTVRPGSALIVESIDRISRQGIDEGYDLCKRILKAGIRLVTLTPEREFGPEAVRSLLAHAGALSQQVEPVAATHRLTAPADVWAMVLGTGLRGTYDSMTGHQQQLVEKRVLDEISAGHVNELQTNVIFAVATKV